MRNRPTTPTSPLITALATWACAACSPGAPSSPGVTTGSILVGVATSGAEAPDAFQVTVDDGRAHGVSSNGSVSLGGIPPGTHAVELISIPVNCAVDGSNPREAIVGEAGTAEVGFTVLCVTVPRGNLSVTTTTSGEDVDPDGYEVSVDDGVAEPIDLDDTRTFPDLTVGNHDVELTGVAANCAIQGDNPRSMPVAGGQTTPTTFAVVCEITTGAIRVTAFTSGTFQDTNGYTVDVDGKLTETVPPNGSVTFDPVAAGTHGVTLGDIRSTCQVDGDNPVAIEVTTGETADVEFRVRCRLF
jgi:hypothetical protein